MARLLVFATLLLAISGQDAKADLTYEVLRETKIPGIKRSLDVRLSERPDEAGLRDIAMKLKALDPAVYERTFIVYYLPGMEPGAGGWATSHFNPNLEVKILGMTREQEEALTSKIDSSVLGIWASRGILAAVVTIERSSKGLLMREKFKDGSERQRLLKEAHEPQPGRRYHYKEGSDIGEHVRINQAGDLEFWDEDGLISTATKR
jgi:hypothetical protein